MAASQNAADKRGRKGASAATPRPLLLLAVGGAEPDAGGAPTAAGTPKPAAPASVPGRAPATAAQRPGLTQRPSVPAVVSGAGGALHARGGVGASAGGAAGGWRKEAGKSRCGLAPYTRNTKHETRDTGHET